VKRARTHNGALVIEQNNATGEVSYWQKGDHQSVADRTGVSLAEYIHAIFGLLRQAKARDVLMIGCGGGTLATMLHRAGASVTLVDIDPGSFDIARRYFNLPDEIPRHVGDGAQHLRKTNARYDAIVLDAYSGSTMPKHFLTPAFFELAKSRMRPRNAVFAVNLLVADDDDCSPDRVVSRMRETWRYARLLDAEGWDNRNAVAVAGAVSKLNRPKLLMPPTRGAAKIARGLAQFSFRRMRRVD
jgi:predicted O-methyltransferase YrrM